LHHKRHQKSKPKQGAGKLNKEEITNKIQNFPKNFSQALLTIVKPFFNIN